MRILYRSWRHLYDTFPGLEQAVLNNMNARVIFIEPSQRKTIFFVRKGVIYSIATRPEGDASDLPSWAVHAAIINCPHLNIPSEPDGWACEYCGASIGYLGRALKHIGFSQHVCSPIISVNQAKEMNDIRRAMERGAGL